MTAAVGPSLVLADGTARGVRRLVRDETYLVSRLWREPDGVQAMQSSLADRVTVSNTPEPGLDDVRVERREVLTGRAPVYDADDWDAIGVVSVRAPASLAGRPPRWLITILLAVLPILIWLAWLWTDPSRLPYRRRFALVAAAVLAIPPGVAVRWSLGQLREATDHRMDVTATAVAGLPDLQAILDRPGGVRQLTGLDFLVRGADSEAMFSTLPPRPTAALAGGPPARRMIADRMRYAVRDVGPVRLVMVPYEHTLFRWLPALGTALVLFGLAAAAASLTPLLERPAELRRRVTAWTFLAPSFVHLSVFTLGPLAFAAWLSTHRWSLIEEARPFVGLDNYARVVTDTDFWRAIVNTTLFTLHVPVAMAVALGLALLLHGRGRAAPLLRGVLFLPTVTSLVALAVVWQWMFNEEFGIFNWVLSWVGIPPVPWLTSPGTAMPSLMLMSVWLVVGYQVILFQAGLTAIPRHLYDAARIDGANAWNRFRHVTLPGLRPTLFFVLVTSVIGSFQVFGAVYVMTEGGPLRATDVAVFHIYEEAWEFLRFGDAAAMSWILFAIIFGVTWLHFRTLERRVEAS